MSGILPSGNQSNMGVGGGQGETLGGPKTRIPRIQPRCLPGILIHMTTMIIMVAMVTEVSAVNFRQNLGEMLNQVQYRNDSIVIKKDGKPVAALVDAELFARIRRMQDRFDELSKSARRGLRRCARGRGYGGDRGGSGQSSARSMSATLRVVLDTNVLVSGILYPAGTPGRILNSWRQGQLDVVLSRHILDEMARVLPTLTRNPLSSSEIRNLADSFMFKAEIVEPGPGIADESLRDAADVPVLGTLLASRADYIITGDKDLLALADEYSIVTPAAFWARHGG